ncbi:protein DOUBLE-STRAND BREAK FORMATION [Sesamum alatum]|uniref:Protein DOUBLE-STRAND BREAK FORMATION n=1 Tax=Sesamum alatum TaxID=300844 RepID=A0AAE2C813_9LAMI|nr:protein DOUBLE-STRAND BREAK FORMATION [Sesamum alatum]
MSNSTALPQQISLFRSRIQSRSFDDVTVRVLETILVSRDVQSLIGVRSALTHFMRDESLLIVREISVEPVEIKLLCADFLIHIFAIIGDVESCLTLRYEALTLREQKATTYPELQVACKEWLTFAEHSAENGFHSIANQACEKALMCSKANHVANPKMDDVYNDMHALKKIKRVKDVALFTISSQSVQAQVALYLKQKELERSTPQLASSIEAQSSGSSRFRSGIRKHNMRKLHHCRCL